MSENYWIKEPRFKLGQYLCDSGPSTSIAVLLNNWIIIQNAPKAVTPKCISLTKEV